MRSRSVSWLLGCEREANAFDAQCMIAGPEGTPYAGGLFEVSRLGCALRTQPMSFAVRHLHPAHVSPHATARLAQDYRRCVRCGFDCWSCS